MASSAQPCLLINLGGLESQREEVYSQLHAPAWSKLHALDPPKIFTEHKKHTGLSG